MILFCYSSVLVKLYVLEESSRGMQTLAATATTIAVCRIAGAERMAALARQAREFPGDSKAIETVRNRLRTD